jgi:predicted RNase H-like nuclease (RuvC/YqgF family)
MTNEEIQKIVARAEDEYEMLKDKVHEQHDEIERLNNIISKTIECIYQDEDISRYSKSNLLDILKEFK